MICFRLLHTTDPAPELLQAVTQMRGGTRAAPVYSVEPDSFQLMPNAPFAYWVSDRIRRLFTELPPFEGEGRTVRVGLQTGDDFRFVRLAWETPISPTEAPDRIWFPFAKGGSYSPFYADVYLKVNYQNHGFELSTFSGSVIRNPDFYFRPGLTWPLRTQSGLGFRYLPKSCVFGHKGPQASSDQQLLLPLLSLTLSASFKGLVELQISFGSYEVGVIQRSPVPQHLSEELTTHGKYGWTLHRQKDQNTLESHAFFGPSLAPSNKSK